MKNVYAKNAFFVTSLSILCLAGKSVSDFSRQFQYNFPKPYYTHQPYYSQNPQYSQDPHYSEDQHYSPRPHYSRHPHYTENQHDSHRPHYWQHSHHSSQPHYSENKFDSPNPHCQHPPLNRHHQYHSHNSHHMHQHAVKLLHLDEGDICRRGHMVYPDYVCTNAKNCSESLMESIKSKNFLDVCSIDGPEMIFCCPTMNSENPIFPNVNIPMAEVTQPTAEVTQPTADVTQPIDEVNQPTAEVTQPTIEENSRAPEISQFPVDVRKKIDNPLTDSDTTTFATDNVQNSSIAVEKCRQYTELDYPKKDNFFIAVVGGTQALSQEFPHMAIIGYGMTTNNQEDWKCGGSLISERWVLTAAHCRQDRTTDSLARWVRLGDLDIKSTTDFAEPKDFRIVEHVTHPDYKPTVDKRYNDIALFRLETDVIFSSYIRPICVNADPLLNPSPQIATGWGRTATDESTSDMLLKVQLNILEAKQCNDSYFSNDRVDLKSGILPDSMICAGSDTDYQDTCSGDSGGPLQVQNENNPNTYTQFGITSFGSAFCGVKEIPGVYTRVSKYVPWIEQIVWSNN